MTGFVATERTVVRTRRRPGPRNPPASYTVRTVHRSGCRALRPDVDYPEADPLAQRPRQRHCLLCRPGQ